MVMQPFFAPRRERDGVSILEVTVGLSVFVVLSSFLLATVRTPSMLVGAVVVLVAAVAAVVLRLLREIADDERHPSRPRTFSMRAPASGPLESTSTRAPNRSPIAGARMAIALGGVQRHGGRGDHRGGDGRGARGDRVWGAQRSTSGAAFDRGADADGWEDAVRARLYGQRTHTVRRLPCSGAPRATGQPRARPTSLRTINLQRRSVY